jgi:hypothetical protein
MDSRRTPSAPTSNATCENHGLRTHRLSMDIERINSIGALLADLSSRTLQLRGYL